MRTAEDIVRDYRKRGYSDARIRAIANNRPDSVREGILALLDEETLSAGEEALHALDAEEAPEVPLPDEEAEEEPEELEEVAWDESGEECEDDEEEWDAEEEDLEEAACEDLDEEGDEDCEDEIDEEDETGADDLEEAAWDEDDEVDEAESVRAPAASAEESGGDVMADSREEAAVIGPDGSVFGLETGSGELWPRPSDGEPVPGGEVDFLEAYESRAALESAAGQTEGRNVIAFDPPYRVPEAERQAPAPASPAAGGDGDDLVHFPREMLAYYEAVRNARPHGAPDVPPMEGGWQEAFSTEEILRLRAWLNELESTLRTKEAEVLSLARELMEKDETLQQQADEIGRLRDDVVDSDEGEAPHMRELEASLARIEAERDRLQRENNILSTGTVPDLEQDKDDLVRLLEEEAEEKERMADALQRSSRRVTLSHAMTGVALTLLVLMPIFFWNQTIRPTERDVSGGDLLAEREARIRKAHAAEIAALEERAESLRQRREEERARWQTERETLERRLATRQDTSGTMTQRIGRTREEPTSQHEAPPTPGEVALANESLRRAPPAAGGLAAGAELSRRPALGEETAAHIGHGTRPHFNGLEGLAEWQRRRAAEPEILEVTVRKGEGLSQVLWRTYGTINDPLMEWAVRKNDLRVDGRGNPILHPEQKLVLPKNPEAVASLD